MKAKTKTCSGCGQPRVIWKNDQGERFCKECWFRKRPGVRLKKTSAKQKLAETLYTDARRVYLTQPGNRHCHGRLTPDCTGGDASLLTIHHMKGRGTHLLDTSTWVPLCPACHRYVELHPDEARDLCLTDSRLAS